MSIVTDSCEVHATDPLVVQIDYSSVMDTAAGPIDERAAFCLDRSNVQQLAEALTRFLCADQPPRLTITAGDDNIVVYESGPEQAPYVNLENRRPKDAPRGGMNWVAMSRRVAHALAAELRTLAQASTGVGEQSSRTTIRGGREVMVELNRSGVPVDAQQSDAQQSDEATFVVAEARSDRCVFLRHRQEAK